MYLPSILLDLRLVFDSYISGSRLENVRFKRSISGSDHFKKIALDEHTKQSNQEAHVWGVESIVFTLMTS